jgi:hypothetical protein
MGKQSGDSDVLLFGLEELHVAFFPPRTACCGSLYSTFRPFPRAAQILDGRLASALFAPRHPGLAGVDKRKDSIHALEEQHGRDIEPNYGQDAGDGLGWRPTAVHKRRHSMRDDDRRRLQDKKRELTAGETRGRNGEHHLVQQCAREEREKNAPDRRSTAATSLEHIVSGS